MNVNMTYWKFYHNDSIDTPGRVVMVEKWEQIPPACRNGATSHKIKVPMDQAFKKDFDLLNWIKDSQKPI